MAGPRSRRGLVAAAALALLVAVGAGGPRAAAAAVLPSGTMTVAPAGTATWAQILANAGVVPPPLAPPVTTDSFLGTLGGTGGLQPPDTTGAVGPNHVVTFLNGSFRIRTKTGQDLGIVTDRQFWYRLAPSFVSDPKVVYDPGAGRWMAIQTANYTTSTAFVPFAISDTSDPTGRWTFYAIDADAANLAWPDYPHLGFNGTWIAITGNQYNNAATSFLGIKMWLIDKATALAGGPLTISRFEQGFDFGVPDGAGFTYSPALTIGAEPVLYMVSTHDNSVMRLSMVTGAGPAPVWDVVPGSTWVASSGEFTVAPGNAWNFLPPGAPQSGSAILIATNDARTQDCVFRDGRLWTAHVGGTPVGSPTRAVGIWYELDPLQMAVTGSPVVQTGNTGSLEGSSFHHYFPAVAPNATRDAIVGFSRSASTIFAEAAWSYRLVGDAANALRPLATIKAGEDSYVGSRWGDYSQAQADPCDDRTLWTIQEYAASRASGGPRWSTWWQRVATAPSPPSVTCPAPQVLEATGPTGRSVTLSFSVSAPGSTPLTLTLLEGSTIVGTATVPAGGPPTTGTPSITATYPLGIHSLTAVVNDCSGTTATCTTTVAIADATPPSVTATLKRTILWTARNALEDVGLASSATDLVAGAPTFVSTSVFSDEGHLTNAPGPDGTLSGALPTSTLRLRSQRKTNPAGLPPADGRVYLVVVRWTDGTNVGFAAKTVICPIAMTPTKLGAANAQAAAALAFANANAGAPPAGFFPIVP